MKLCLYKNSEINEKKIYKTPSLPRAIKEGDYEKKGNVKQQEGLKFGCYGFKDIKIYFYLTLLLSSSFYL